MIWWVFNADTLGYLANVMSYVVLLGVSEYGGYALKFGNSNAEHQAF